MRRIRQLAAVTLAAVLTSVALLPTGPAAAGHQRSEVDIWDHTTYEYSKSCIFQDECNKISEKSLRFVINIRNRPKPNHPIDVDWQLVDVTTTAGADYTGPTSGTITFGPNDSQEFLLAPVVNDGVDEAATETVELHITDISEQIDIRDVGIGTIQDGAQIPEDCDLAYVDGMERSMTCTDRPAGQQWHLNIWCVAFGRIDVAVGNTVTGNGTSNARCTSKPPNRTFFVLES